MQTNVDVAELKTIIQSNRDDHLALYREAMEAYRAKAVTELNKFLDQIANDREIAIVWRLPIPEQHLDDYDRVLKLLDLTVDETVELNDGEISMYVLNEWGWARSFASNTTAYTNS